MEFILPDSVMNILSRLETDGFSAFVAGGAVIRLWAKLRMITTLQRVQDLKK